MKQTRQILGLEKPRDGETTDLTRKNLGMVTGGIGQIVDGLGNLRNSDGSFAHGADAFAPVFEPGYAEILARAADAAVGFLFKSHLSQISENPHDRVEFGSYSDFDDTIDADSKDITIFEAPIRPSEALYYCEPQLYDNELRRYIRDKKDAIDRNQIISNIASALIKAKS